MGAGHSFIFLRDIMTWLCYLNFKPMIVVTLITFLVRRHIVHTLVGGGGQRNSGRFDTWLLEDLQDQAWWRREVGGYSIPAMLPDNLARFLYEFHDFRFESLDLPGLHFYPQTDESLMCMERLKMRRFVNVVDYCIYFTDMCYYTHYFRFILII